ncbi:hypothetical protein [Halorubrum vacuolatum]|uniref:Uncharacterized protein n=1 Tax=Halorubrum vacuolatum TaxID=63740 RepID=A0A238WLA6_HALVU|nr:hypothetical protein [Halorubrum vacuolatum]SNR47267.1 hypothetical protein SAMN06264855_108117 [Halorubrum vacuolatum]
MSAAEQAVDNASQLEDLGFAEFTAKLISEVFDAIVSSNIRQQEAYAELLERVSLSVQEFETESVTDADVREFLAERFPGEDPGTTSFVEGHEVTAEEADRAGRLFESAAADPDLDLSIPEEGETLDEDGVENVERLASRRLARRRLNALQEMVETGVIRTVVETGRIETRLEFTTYGRDTSRRSSSRQRRTSAGASVRAGGGIGRVFGISGRANASRMTASSVNRSNTAYTSAQVEIGGKVELNLRGDYVPLRTPEE